MTPTSLPPLKFFNLMGIPVTVVDTQGTRGSHNGLGPLWEALWKCFSFGGCDVAGRNYPRMRSQDVLCPHGSDTYVGQAQDFLSVSFLVFPIALPTCWHENCLLLHLQLFPTLYQIRSLISPMWAPALVLGPAIWPSFILGPAQQ